MYVGHLLGVGYWFNLCITLLFIYYLISFVSLSTININVCIIDKTIINFTLNFKNDK